MNARSRFYASMSHELRTPINAIIGYNTLLLDNIYGPLNERQTQGLQRTHKAAKHLLELVNDVLALNVDPVGGQVRRAEGGLHLLLARGRLVQPGPGGLAVALAGRKITPFNVLLGAGIGCLTGMALLSLARSLGLLFRPPPTTGMLARPELIPGPGGGGAAAVRQAMAQAEAALPILYPTLNLVQRVMLRIGPSGMDLLEGGIDGFGQAIDPNPTVILPVGASSSYRAGFVAGYIGGQLVTAARREEEEEEDE